MYQIEYFDAAGTRIAALPAASPLLATVDTAERRMGEFHAETARIVHARDGSTVWAHAKDVAVCNSRH